MPLHVTFRILLRWHAYTSDVLSTWGACTAVSDGAFVSI
jgi:hypothetical protein